MKKRKSTADSTTIVLSKKNKCVCQCCGNTFSKLSNHLHKKKKCQDWYTDQNDFFLTSQENITSVNNDILSQTHKVNQLKINQLPKASYSMFGKYRTIPEMEIIEHYNHIDINSMLYDVEDNNNIDHNTTTITNTSINNSGVLDYSSVSAIMLRRQEENNYDPMTLASIKLFKILQKANAPLYLYDEIHKFIKHTYPIMKILNKKQIKKRKRLLEILYTTILNGSEDIRENHLEFNMFPIMKKATLAESSIEFHVATFDIKSIIVSLLIDPLIMRDNNLLIDDPAYLRPMEHHHQIYDDIHTGYWFRNAHNHLCKSENDLLCPLIFFIDGVSLDKMQKQTLEPVSFTLGIFKRNARNSNNFWRILGYIPNVEKMFNFKYTKEQINKYSLKKKHYHQLLNVIFEDLDKLQKNGGLKWTFKNGKTYTLKFPIMYIIGDALGLDKLCNRKLTYTPTKTFMTGCCRDCNSVYKHCHDPDYICHYHNTSTIQQLPEKLKDILSFIPNKLNALTKLCFGGDKCGLLGCCPPEPLHQWYLGIIELIIDYFWSRITTKTRDYLDVVIRGIALECYRQSDREMPSIHQFKNGLMKEKLTGMERYGQLFVLFLAFLPTKVREKIVQLDNNSPNRYTKINNNEKIIHPKIINTGNKFDKWLLLFQNMISITSWLKLEQVPASDINKSINVTLKQDDYIFSQEKFDNNGDINENEKYIKSIMDNIDIINDGTCNNNKSSTSYVTTKISKSNKYLREFIRQIHRTVPEVDMKRFQRLKVHHTLHYDDYIAKNGCVANFNGATNEEHMKSQVTHPGKHTQRRIKTLCIQTARRYSENLIVNIGNNIAISSNQYNSSLFACDNEYFNNIGIDHYYEKEKINNNVKSNEEGNMVDVVASGYYTYTVDTMFDQDEYTNKSYEKILYTKSKGKKSTTNSTLVNNSSHIDKNFLKDVFVMLERMGMFEKQQKSKLISTFTMLNKSGIIFRCNEKFYDDQSSEWFDWIKVKWTYKNGITMTLPAKLLMLIDINMTCTINKTSKDRLRKTCPEGNYWAVIRSGQKPQNNQRHHTNKIKLVSYYNMYDQLSIVSTYNIESPAFVIYDRDYSMKNDTLIGNLTIQNAINIEDVSKWSDIFMND